MNEPTIAPSRYYIVIGRDGPHIHEYVEADGSYGANSLAFNTREDAKEWLDRHGLQDATHSSSSGYPNSTTYYQEDDLMEDETIVASGSATHDLPTPPPEPQAVLPPQPQQHAEGRVVLSPEQQHVLDLVNQGENVFYTGPAGTGKSVLLREIVKTLRRKYDNDPGAVAVTAPTGIAGLNVGGSTIHSFAGIRLGKEKATVLAKRIAKSMFLAQRWREVRTLIIDEISMLDGRLFDKLEHIARQVRNSSLPFGGVQLVLSGDFCQLPPVPDESHRFKMASNFAFDANSWEICIPRPPVFLTQVFRQRDSEFIDLLGQMRIGQLKEKHIQMLQSLSRPLVYADGIEPSYLFPIRAEAEACNKERLQALQTPPVTYEAMDAAGFDVFQQAITKEQALKLLERQIAPQIITLKVGAQVMLIKNIVPGLVNGSCGKVIEFITIHEAMKRHIRIAELKGGQREHDDEPELGPSKPKRSGPPPEFVPLNEVVYSPTQEWPLVEFTSGDMLLCAPVDFTVEGFMGNVEAKRTQVPLILAWALSIHKSQGQTLQRVKIDLGRVFEKGQAYVAISRATTMEHLEIVNFNPAKVEAHPRVIAWQRQHVPPTSLSQVHAAPSQATSSQAQAAPSQVARSQAPPSTPTRTAATTIYPKTPKTPIELDEELWAEMDSDYAVRQYFTLYDR